MIQKKQRSFYVDQLIAWGHYLEWGHLPANPMKAFRRYSGLTVTGDKASDELKARYAILRTMKYPEKLRAKFGDTFIDMARRKEIRCWETRENEDEFVARHMIPVGDLQGEYLYMCPIRSTLDGKFTAYQLRMIAFAMDNMRNDPDLPVDFDRGWYKEDEQ